MSAEFWRTPGYSPRPTALFIIVLVDDALLYDIVASDADCDLLQSDLRIS